VEQKDDRVEWNAFLNVNTNFNSPRLSESHPREYYKVRYNKFCQIFG